MPLPIIIVVILWEQLVSLHSSPALQPDMHGRVQKCLPSLAPVVASKTHWCYASLMQGQGRGHQGKAEVSLERWSAFMASLQHKLFGLSYHRSSTTVRPRCDVAVVSLDVCFCPFYAVSLDVLAVI